MRCYDNRLVKEITLTQGKAALVDAEDYERLSRYNWCAAKNHNTYYAIRLVNFPKKEGKIERLTMGMHQQILRWFEGIDHINHDGLDNRRENLRKAAHATNAQNNRKRLGATSRYVGVCWNKKARKWVASIKIDGHQNYLGSFDFEIDAAAAYDVAALMAYPGYVQLNLSKKAG